MAITNARVAAAATIFFAGVGIYCIAVGMTHAYYDLMGPGPGFFPIWIGGLLAALSLGLLVTVLRSPPGSPDARDPGAPAADEPFFESAGAGWRVVRLLAALLVVCWLLDVLGFRLTIFLFALVGPRLIEPQPVIRSVVVALLCSFGVAYGFETWLNVQLPGPSIGILDDLGF